MVHCNKKTRRSSGFTMVELMVVPAIMAILAALVGGGLIAYTGDVGRNGELGQGQIAAKQALGLGTFRPGLPRLLFRIQQGKGFVHIQGAGMALFLPGIAHLRGHVFCYCAAALLKTKIRARRRQLSGHGAFGIAKAEQPGQIGLNMPLGDGFGPAKIGILPAQKFGQLRKVAAVSLECGR